MTEKQLSLGSPLSGAEIDALVEGEEFSYQKIDLPHGRTVGIRDRASTALAIFPSELKGKSVLDIGCNYGYFCFEAKKRGASRVVGVDIDKDALRKARLLASILDIDIEFQLGDVEEILLRESFDYVLCLNVLHHLNHPFALLDQLIRITDERLVLEVATLGSHDGRNLGLSFLTRAFLNRFPIMYVAPTEIEPNREIKNCYLTPKAIEHLLLWQRRVFASLQTFSSDYKDRFLSVAHKRRIGHMLVLAGPTSSGKRTVAKALSEGRIPELAKILDVVENPSVFGEPMKDSNLRESGPAVVERMIIRYDILRPRFTNVHGLGRDPVLDVLKTAARTTFVTIFAPPSILKQQLEASEKKKKQKWSNRHKRMYAHFGNISGLKDDYLDWFAFTDRFQGNHYVIFPQENMRIMVMSEFRKLLPNLLRSTDETISSTVNYSQSFVGIE